MKPDAFNYEEYLRVVKENEKLNEIFKDSFTKHLLDELNRKDKELEQVKAERDSLLADLTKICAFYRTTTVCELCKYDSENQEYGCKHREELGIDSRAMNICWEWRGYKDS